MDNASLHIPINSMVLSSGRNTEGECDKKTKFAGYHTTFDAELTKKWLSSQGVITGVKSPQNTSPK
ncbi:hypothetical protein [Endozoicomonas atrinae]|uniref:hypothetical protein n=1 Tax=Endozoicomonas atrinae TaxID=1333660 RepID=UPI001112FD64|nr:hypothetical protein [Endozoicomonas atrinae]